MAKIVIMLNRLVIGGAPLDTVQLAGYLSAKHEVYLLVGEKNKDEYDASFMLEPYPAVKVIHVNEVHRSINLFNDVNAFFHIKNILQKIKPDIVHTNGAKPGLLGRIAAAMLNVPIIIHTYHGHVFHSYFNRFFSQIVVRVERLLARYSTKIIAISESQKNELADIYKICLPEKIEVINLGIDVAKFNNNKTISGKLFRDKYLLQDNEIAIGIVGRIVPVKNHFLFLDVVEKTIAKTSVPVRFFIIGDGALRNDLMKTLDRKHIDHVFFPEEQKAATVTFTSWILEIEQAMNGLDIVVLTSLNEGVPIALLEAGAASKPVISTKAGAVTEVINDNETGFIISACDIAAFSEKLLMLIENKDLRHTMGNKGFAAIEEKYSKQKEMESIDALYSALLSSQANML